MINLFDRIIEWLFPKHTLTKTFVVYSSDINRIDDDGGPYVVEIEEDMDSEGIVEFCDSSGSL